MSGGGFGTLLRNELLGLVRDRRLLLLGAAAGLLVLLTVLAGSAREQEARRAREAAVATARTQWLGQGAVNPHSAAHFGDYAFKPQGALARLDEGVQLFTGKVLYLEAHVQNTANQAEASRSGTEARLGAFQTAFLLQAVLPLLLLFTGFASVSRDRESGLLRQLCLGGASARALLAAKAVAVGALALGLLVVLVLSDLAVAVAAGASLELGRLLAFVAVHALYLLTLAALAVVVSTLAADGRSALAGLLVLWLAWVVLLPRATAQLGETLAPLPSRLAFDEGMRADRARGLDGHNPADQRTRELEREVLARHGVSRVEDLPLNLDGLLMQEDEDYGAKVWDVHFERLHQRRLSQLAPARWSALANPYQAVRNLSMSLAGTDLLHDAAFERQAERHRRAFVAVLNREHAYGGSRTGDWDWQAAPEFLATLPTFEFSPPTLAEALGGRRLELLGLGLWVGLTVAGLTLAARRLTFEGGSR